MIKNRVKDTRIDRDISQKKLADLAGITRQALHAIENGRSAPGLEVALRLAEALGCKLERIFWIDDDPGAFTLFDHKLIDKK